MRATLADPSLARYAGRFVWLELDFDKPVNQEFLARHGVMYTPTLLVLDPVGERPTATQLGGLTLPELVNFLERGEKGVLAKATTPAGVELARGDEMLGRGRRAEAIAAYREALRLGGENWPDADRALGSLTWVLAANGEPQACAETAATHAPRMERGQLFARVVLSGLGCVNQSPASPWAEDAQKVLEPLATEAIAQQGTLRDHRFQLYQQLMAGAEARGDKATVAKWGGLWLKELEATKPINDDERSALDVARVDAASIEEVPERVIPALIESEHAMPNNYNASLRLAQMEVAAKRYDDAIAACERGLQHVSGPIGRTWLMQTKAEALSGKGDLAGARRALDEALVAAKAVGQKNNRDNNVRRVQRMLAELDKPQGQ